MCTVELFQLILNGSVMRFSLLPLGDYSTELRISEMGSVNIPSVNLIKLLSIPALSPPCNFPLFSQHLPLKLCAWVAANLAGDGEQSLLWLPVWDALLGWSWGGREGWRQAGLGDARRTCTEGLAQPAAPTQGWAGVLHGSAPRWALQQLAWLSACSTYSSKAAKQPILR